MELIKIAGKNTACGGTSTGNTGKLGCQIEWGVPLHLIRVRKGFVIPKETDFNLTYIREKIQEGIFVPLIGAETFENESSEDQMQANTRGVERLNVLGLPKFKFIYEEGHEFYKQMASLTNYKGSDFIMIDEAGNWKVAVTSEGDFKGFTVGQALALMTGTKVSGGENESKAFTIQVLDRLQWDKEYTFFLRSELGFSPEEIDGVNGVNLSYNAVPAAGTTINVQVLLNADMNTPVEGLTAPNFIFHNGAVSTVVSALTETPGGNYALTVPAYVATDEVWVETWDDTVKTSRILVDEVLYQGQSQKAIAVS